MTILEANSKVGYTMSLESAKEVYKTSIEEAIKANDR
jgi:hypothetical protein